MSLALPAVAAPTAPAAEPGWRTVAEGVAGSDFAVDRGRVLWQVHPEGGGYGLRLAPRGGDGAAVGPVSGSPFAGFDVAHVGGGPMVAFARCGTRPGACNVFRMDPASGRVRRQPGASRPGVDEAFPSLSGPRLAWSGVDRFRDGTFGPGGDRISVAALSGRGRVRHVAIPTRRAGGPCGGTLRSATPLIGFALRGNHVLHQLFYFGRGCERDLLVDRDVVRGRARLVGTALRRIDGRSYAGSGIEAFGFGPIHPFRSILRTGATTQTVRGLRIDAGGQVRDSLEVPAATEQIEVDGSELYRSECTGGTCRILRATGLRVVR